MLQFFLTQQKKKYKKKKKGNKQNPDTTAFFLTQQRKSTTKKKSNKQNWITLDFSFFLNQTNPSASLMTPKNHLVDTMGGTTNPRFRTTVLRHSVKVR